MAICGFLIYLKKDLIINKLYTFYILSVFNIHIDNLKSIMLD